MHKVNLLKEFRLLGQQIRGGGGACMPNHQVDGGSRRAICTITHGQCLAAWSSDHCWLYAKLLVRSNSCLLACKEGVLPTEDYPATQYAEAATAAAQCSARRLEDSIAQANGLSNAW